MDPVQEECDAILRDMDKGLSSLGFFQEPGSQQWHAPTRPFTLDLAPSLASRPPSPSARAPRMSPYPRPWTSSSATPFSPQRTPKATSEKDGPAIGASPADRKEAPSSPTSSALHRRRARSTCTIYIPGLSHDSTAPDVVAAFSRFGFISSSQLLLGGYRSRKKTVYLDFLRPQDAAEAVKVMHGSSTHLASHPLKVSFASAPLQSVSLPS